MGTLNFCHRRTWIAPAPRRSGFCGRALIPSLTLLLLGFPAGAQTNETRSNEDALLHLRLATGEAAQGRLAEAAADARAAIALRPGLSSGWYELGAILGQAGHFEEAESALRQAIRLQPDSAKAHFSLALTLVGNSQNRVDWPTAIVECREALRLQPNYPEAESLLGTGLTDSGRTDEAI